MDKISLTRLELKKQRERLARFRRFLPALQLRQQRLQRALERTRAELTEARLDRSQARERFDAYRSILGDLAGLDLFSLAKPDRVRTETRNVAGVQVPVLEKVSFRAATYSLVVTPAWTDRTLEEMRAITVLDVRVEILESAAALLRHELTRVIQRVNLFEKVKIPEAESNIHRIRIHLGDEMAAAVGRAKIAKSRQAPGGGTPGGERIEQGWVS
jgi:V/A-type H+-transporting ATPase subunit D